MKKYLCMAGLAVGLAGCASYQGGTGAMSGTEVGSSSAMVGGGWTLSRGLQEFEFFRDYAPILPSHREDPRVPPQPREFRYPDALYLPWVE